MAIEQITPTPVDRVTITTLIDNASDLLAEQGRRARDVAYRSPRPPSAITEDGRRFDSLIGEHGFSALVEVTADRRTTTLLYDAGLSPDGLRENMRRLEIDPRDIQLAVMSHSHYDHTTGLEGIIRDLGAAATPMVVHPDFWARRRLLVDGTERIELPTPSRSALRDHGVEIIESAQPSFLVDGSVLVTGEVDRTTEFERGLPGQEAFRDGQWVPDEATLDDQALVLNVSGKGLVVLSGCGHAGIVNIVRYAKRLTGIERVHAVIGGFHLSGKAFEPIIGRTVDALARLEPALLVPSHCTGWKAHHALGARFGAAYYPNSVGVQLVI